MPAPTIVIIPGLWLGIIPYELLVEELQKAAPQLSDFIHAPLISTGKTSPGNPTMHDDAMGIRAVIKPLVEAGKRLVLVGHSAGAFLSAMATEDLEVGGKIAVQSGGGVEKFIFIAGGILPAGAPHPVMNFFRIENGGAYCKDPDGILFHDTDPVLAEKYKALLKPQPAEDWNGVCTYAGWSKVPSGYILTEHDRAMPVQIQEACAGIAESEIVRIPTGHMPMTSHPKLLAEKVLTFIDME
ncbi:alpha/beta-hydrolase [Aspergillus karnatakaensis]|uniref:alpha/beta hydrolase n=1 Tax=Aspergillus karnatakaensis TaxID=1810916 RepID=UPI003CCE2C9A